jgi:hypothetical protein
MRDKNVHPGQAHRASILTTPSRFLLESTERDANRINASHVGRTAIREYRVSSGAVCSFVI